MALSVREQIIKLLRGPTVARIRFTFPSDGATITVSAASYHRVANAIDRGRITVRVTNDPAELAANAGAQYDTDPGHGLSGTILIRPEYIGRELEGRIVHECTHAAFDLAGLDNLVAQTEEAAAYVAQVLYYRMTNLPQDRWTTMIRDVALGAADELLKEYQAGNTPIPAVDLVNFHLIRAVIPMSPTYGVTPDQPRGTPASRGESYIHNG